ncbi:MAG: response regulator [Chloroflexaceae bacterium]|nr:response regulator [Chloroflexaceae bacterium]
MSIKPLSSQIVQSCFGVPRILVVDDSEDNLLLLTQALEIFECEIITARDGLEALTWVSDRPPDLILLDIVMPRLNGIELMRCLQSLSPQRRIPIVAVTGLALAPERELILQAGCDDYLVKPFLLRDLETIVCRYLGHRFGVSDPCCLVKSL